APGHDLVDAHRAEVFPLSEAAHDDVAVGDEADDLPAVDDRYHTGVGVFHDAGDVPDAVAVAHGVRVRRHHVPDVPRVVVSHCCPPALDTAMRTPRWWLEGQLSRRLEGTTGGLRRAGPAGTVGCHRLDARSLHRTWPVETTNAAGRAGPPEAPRRPFGPKDSRALKPDAQAGGCGHVAGLEGGVAPVIRAFHHHPVAAGDGEDRVDPGIRSEIRLRIRVLRRLAVIPEPAEQSGRPERLREPVLHIQLD